MLFRSGGVAAATGPSCTPLILDGVHGIFLEGAGPEFDAKLARQALLVKVRDSFDPTSHRRCLSLILARRSTPSSPESVKIAGILAR